MINIALIGIFYPLAMLRYFERALRRRDDVNLITAGIYTGNWIPWNGGMRLPQKYAKAPDVLLTAGTNIVSSLPMAFAEARLPAGFEADLWLQIDAGFHLTGKPRFGMNVVVGTDPHVLNYDRQRKLADRFYCMQRVYAKPGDSWLPYAYDPEWHAPMLPPEATPMQFDCCLLGLHYEQRNAWVNGLRDRGLTVDYDLGPIGWEAKARYAAAFVGLNWSSLKDLNARVFELLAMDKVAVCNIVPDLTEFFVPGRDLLTFTTLSEAIEKVMWAVDNPGSASDIASAGHYQVKRHTWDARVRQIIKECL